eukprot:5269622-Prymnesium_polylepis.1
MLDLAYDEIDDQGAAADVVRQMDQSVRVSISNVLDTVCIATMEGLRAERRSACPQFLRSSLRVFRPCFVTSGG